MRQEAASVAFALLVGVGAGLAEEVPALGLELFDAVGAPKGAFVNIVAPGGAAAPAQPGAAWTVRWARFTDPNEHAFTAAVPADWPVRGGARRMSALEIRPWIDAVSPDGAIELFFGDPDVPVYTVPNQMLAMGGFREGMVYSPGYNQQFVVMRYYPGDAFAAQWGAQRVSRRCPGVSLEGVGAVPQATQRIDLAYAAGGVRATVRAGEASFRCVLSGGPGLGYVFAATELVETQGSALWDVKAVAGFVAPRAQAGEAALLLAHLADSFAIDPAWAARQAGLTGAVSHILAETNKAVSQSISEPFWNRRAAQERSSQGFSQAIRGVETFRDPVTGTERELENRPHQWTDPQGNLYWTNGSDPPVKGARELQLVQPGQ